MWLLVGRRDGLWLLLSWLRLAEHLNEFRLWERFDLLLILEFLQASHEGVLVPWRRLELLMQRRRGLWLVLHWVFLLLLRVRVLWVRLLRRLLWLLLLLLFDGCEDRAGAPTRHHHRRLAR